MNPITKDSEGIYSLVVIETKLGNTITTFFINLLHILSQNKSLYSTYQQSEILQYKYLPIFDISFS